MRKPWSYARGTSIIYAPQIEGMDTVFINGGTAVAQAQPEELDLHIGRPIAFHPEVTHPPQSDRLYPGQPDSARLGIGGSDCFSGTVSARERHIETA